jgi:glyoxylase-like metal-dependent hydrolase (beta-lactamase superfamily II)
MEPAGRIDVLHPAALPGVVWYRGRRVSHAYPRHWHEELHLCAYSAGDGRLRLRGATAAIGAGDLAITPAGEIHENWVERGGACSFRSLYLDVGPVRWLVNTHFHIDHNAGNSAYQDAFPGVEIIAQAATRRFMDDTNPAFAANVIAPDGRPSTELLPAMRRALASGHDDGGNVLSAADRALTVRQIHDIEGEIADYRHYRYEPPTVLFERALTLHLGDRQVVIEHLGRGNTPGDASVWLPRERVLATGDLLTLPVPYMRMGYPREQLEVLRALRGRDARVIVPGHGAVQTDARQLDDVIALLQSVVDQAHEQTAKLPMNPKTKRKSADDLHIDLGAFQRRMAGDDPVTLDFWRSIVEGLGGTANQGLVGRAFDEETGKL